MWCLIKATYVSLLKNKQASVCVTLAYYTKIKSPAGWFFSLCLVMGLSLFFHLISDNPPIKKRLFSLLQWPNGAKISISRQNSIFFDDRITICMANQAFFFFFSAVQTGQNRQNGAAEAAPFRGLIHFSTSCPSSASTVTVWPGRAWPARICLLSMVSTVCWIYRRRGRAPYWGS